MSMVLESTLLVQSTIVSEPGSAEYFIVSFDVEAPPGSFKKEYSRVKKEALWLLCAKPDYYQSTYVCRSRVSAELLRNIVVDVFGGNLRKIALCSVKPSTNEYKAKVEESTGRCRRWTLKVRRRFTERVEKLKAVDAGLADTIKSKSEECFEYTSHGGSTRGSSMVRGGGLQEA